MEWKKVKLKSIFNQYRIEHRVQDDIVYKQVTISKHTGVSFRGEKLGKEIGRKRQFVIDLDLHPHTLMFVRQGVQDGSIGFAPLEVNKCIVTENMPMFSVEDVDVEFIKSYIESSLFKDILNNLSTKGAAQKSIHEKELLEVEILIPKSLEEQKAFGKLIKDSTKNSNNISTEITHQLDLIKNLRQAFLREAMQGILVSNETSDGKTGADLLAEIQAEKAQLVKEKKIKKPKPLAPITEEEIPFDIPENWTWCRLGEISFITSGSTPSSDSFVEKGIPYFKMYNLKNQKIDFWHKPQFIKEDVHNGSLKRCRLFPGDVIMNIVGPPLGKLAIIPNEFPEANFNQAAVLIRSYNLNVNPFIFWYLNEMSAINEIDTKGVAGQANISVTQAHEIKFPLPPLEIQERIVAKLDELMSYCDALEDQVKQSQQTNELLLQQVLREALGA
ncbi:restriction endonuclease subunit S [Empedobacter falsenii]|uniref:restriction endonuclease subunit S n=1 Tax=unclassified Empedobacter TaxID=2643773 RepID=UPI0025BDAB2A|nr:MULTISPECIES: restriction endonuclease subunit S [unclassified Empedobacter]